MSLNGTHSEPHRPAPGLHHNDGDDAVAHAIDVLARAIGVAPEVLARRVAVTQRGGRPRVQVDEAAIIHDRTEGHMTHRAIGHKHGISSFTVRNILARHNVPTGRGNALIAERLDELVLLRVRQRLSIAEICKRLDVSRPTINNALRDLGLLHIGLHAKHGKRS